MTAMAAFYARYWHAVIDLTLRSRKTTDADLVACACRDAISPALTLSETLDVLTDVIEKHEQGRGAV